MRIITLATVIVLAFSTVWASNWREVCNNRLGDDVPCLVIASFTGSNSVNCEGLHWAVHSSGYNYKDILLYPAEQLSIGEVSAWERVGSGYFWYDDYDLNTRYTIDGTYVRVSVWNNGQMYVQVRSNATTYFAVYYYGQTSFDYYHDYSVVDCLPVCPDQTCNCSGPSIFFACGGSSTATVKFYFSSEVDDLGGRTDWSEHSGDFNHDGLTDMKDFLFIMRIGDDKWKAFIEGYLK